MPFGSITLLIHFLVSLHPRLSLGLFDGRLLNLICGQQVQLPGRVSNEADEVAGELVGEPLAGYLVKDVPSVVVPF